jgi:hypothetical protein
MSLHVALAISALAASGMLFLTATSRALATLALVASAVEVAMAVGLLHLSVAHLPLGTLLGLALAVPGVLAWLRSSSKAATTAAAIVAFVGGLQVLSALGRL